jgi:hypothetical protein
MGEDLNRLAVTTTRVQGSEANVLPEASPEFVLTPYVQELTQRALASGGLWVMP